MTNSDSDQPDAQFQPPPPGSTLPFFLAVAMALVAAYGGWKWWQVEQSRLDHSLAYSAAEIGPPLTDFKLTERSGKTFRSQDMRGRVWVVTYFFSTCPGSCLRLNQNIQVMHEMPELEDVTWVSITCDPDTDTLEVLQQYADRWKADPERWLFCRADLDYTQRVADGMNVALYRQAHQDFAIVMDKEGKMRGMFDATSTFQSQQLRKLLLECLEETDDNSQPPIPST